MKDNIVNCTSCDKEFPRYKMQVCDGCGELVCYSCLETIQFTVLCIECVLSVSDEMNERLEQGGE
jgi:hypothetical protein